MMTITWKGRPENYDTHMVTRVWFDERKPTLVYYTIDGTDYVHHARVKEINNIR
jgi:hypothetical protein